MPGSRRGPLGPGQCDPGPPTRSWLFPLPCTLRWFWSGPPQRPRPVAGRSAAGGLAELGVELPVPGDGLVEEDAHPLQALDCVARTGVPLLVRLLEPARGLVRDE